MPRKDNPFFNFNIPATLRNCYVDGHGSSTIRALKTQQQQLELIGPVASRQARVANSCKVGDVKVLIRVVSQL
ncbi:hypothetical protein MTO96_016795 [Rhipicephalus appendiculatus]